jgi:hypothetical protein
MAELDMEINDALDAHRGPENWMSCEEIAFKLEIPVDMVHAVVENRWNILIGESV